MSQVRVPVGGTGGNILVGGFEIGGSTAETVLIRGLRAGLTYKCSVSPAPLAQPVLTLFQGLAPIYSNTVWGGDPVLMSAQGMVGGYAIQSNSADSLLLVTLPPGGYTAQISGANNTTGIATVEISARELQAKQSPLNHGEAPASSRVRAYSDTVRGEPEARRARAAAGWRHPPVARIPMEPTARLAANNVRFCCDGE